MKSSYKVALGGIVGALCLALMFLTGIIPFGTYAFPCFAGIILAILVIEVSYPVAFSVFFCVSALSFLITPDKEATLYFVLFFGYYPIVKSFIERVKSVIVQYLLKFLLFNLAMVAVFYIGLFVFSIPKESFNILDVYLPGVFLAFGNIFFFFYDLCVTRLVSLYIFKWHKIIKNKTKL
ncbi:MAG: hypothetical protein KBS62_07960 [Oscillospiraceae bacterium]|nr:hypothetical protein [Candidatus Ruminococcus equi]